MTSTKSKKRGATSPAEDPQLKLGDMVGLDRLISEAVNERVAQALGGLGGEAAAEAQAAPQDEAPAEPVSLAQQCRDAIASAKEAHPKGGTEAYAEAAGDLLGRAGPFLAKHKAKEFGVFLLRRPYRTALCRAFLTGKAWPRPRWAGRETEAQVALSAVR